MLRNFTSVLTFKLRNELKENSINYKIISPVLHVYA